MVTREYFAQVWWDSTVRRHPELMSDPNAQAQMRSAHTTAVSEGLAPGGPAYEERIADEMGWNNSRSSPRSIPQARAAASEKQPKLERHGYSGAEMKGFESLTDEDAARISGISLDEYKAAKKALIVAGELGSAKRWS
jgi:hypothetical protein